MSNVVHLPIPVDKAVRKVVAELKPKAPNNLLRSQLKNSLCEMGDEAVWQEYRRLEVVRGKNKITEGLNLIRDNESADAAILHLRETLAALDPTFEA